MSKLAILFPGQGSQAVGMAKAIKEDFAEGRAVYEEASDALGMNLLSLCLEGPEDKLQLTENGQPSILTTSLAWYTVLRKRFDLLPAAAAGHSLGEYSALTAAGALPLAQAVPLVRMRGKLMQDAVPVGRGKMAAFLGLDDEPLKALCGAASKGPQSLVVPANFNGPGQIVVAGHADAVDRAMALGTGAENEAWKARKVVPLSVSAPFHSPLMAPVTEAFLPFLKGVSWAPLAFPVVNNLDAALRKEGDWVSILQKQIDHPVLWTACARALEASGVDTYLEVGPGKVLTGLTKRSVSSGKFLNLESAADLAKIEAHLKEVR